MLPHTDWLNEMIATYEPGMESASEHDRNGMFHWWLRQSLTEAELVKLVKLTCLDPDESMAKDVRSYIIKHKDWTPNVYDLLNNA